MSGTAPARKPKPWEAYAKRPEDVPLNSPVPKYGYHVQHAMIPSDGVIYRAMESLGPVPLASGSGRLLRNASIARIAEATAAFTFDELPMPRRTVAHRLVAMAKKNIVVPWETEARSKNSPVGMSWRFPLFDEILGTWAADPEIGTVSRRAFYVIGKGRRHLKPGELVAWNLDHTVAASMPRAQASAVDVGEPGSAVAPAQSPAPAAGADAVEMPVNSGATDLDLEALKDALIDACGGADLDDAKFVWGQVVKACGRRPVPDVEEAAAMVRIIGRDWRKINSRAPLSVGLLRKKISGKVEGWQKKRVEGESAARKQAQWAREDRINKIAEWMRILEFADLPPFDRSAYEQLLRDADGDEIVEARRLRAAIKARSA